MTEARRYLIAEGVRPVHRHDWPHMREVLDYYRSKIEASLWCSAWG